MANIARTKKGALLKEIAPVVDQLVDVVNAILSGEVKITEITNQNEKPSGKFIHADANMVLQLKTGGLGLPPFTDLDTSKRYALIASHPDDIWKVEWSEVCL